MLILKAYNFQVKIRFTILYNKFDSCNKKTKNLADYLTFMRGKR